MVFQDRWYQDGSVDALISYVLSGKTGHPITVAPTGSGKTIIICKFCDRLLTERITSNILILSHVQEILIQNHAALSSYFDGFEIGLFSAGLSARLIKKITVAGIQSVYRNPDVFKHFDVILIDECHLVNHKQEGMYRNFFKAINATYCGLTATPFRLGHGYINQGENALFTDIVYDLSSVDNYNRLVAEGYLSRLIPKETEMDMDLSKLNTVAGDYSQKQLSDRFDREEITRQAIDEVIRYGRNYKKWLLFSIDIDHAEHIAEYLNGKGVFTCCVHSKMGDDREKVIADYKAGFYKAAVNVDIMTTGLDVVDIDLIGQLRPTKSPVIHVQSFGRGSRVVYAPGFDLNTIDGRLAAIEASCKKHCLVLDFPGNTERLGPINDVIVVNKGESVKTGEPIVKACPVCGVYHHPTVKVCDVCDHVFQFKVGISETASTAAIVREKITEWSVVNHVSYSINEGRNGKPDTLLVVYLCGATRVKEWICFSHTGYAKYKADNWVRFRLEGESPDNLYELYKISDELKRPTAIRVDFTDKYPRVIDAKF